MKSTRTNKTKKVEHPGSFFSYTLGFIISLAATLIPYALLEKQLAAGVLFIAIALAAALVQLFVQLVFFLHLDLSNRSRTNLIVFAYTALLVFILVVGTLWIMYHLNTNMMQNVYPNNDISPQSEAY